MKKIKKSNTELGGEAPVKIKMSKTKLYVLVLLIGVGMITWSLISKPSDESSSVVKMEDIKLDDSKGEVGNASGDKQGGVVAGANSLDGILQRSDDSSLGNFKLVSKIGDIYIKTTRDFSNLVGLQVLVLIDGSLDKFELVDIQSAVQKDGFIISQ